MLEVGGLHIAAEPVSLNAGEPEEMLGGMTKQNGSAADSVVSRALQKSKPLGLPWLPKQLVVIFKHEAKSARRVADAELPEDAEHFSWDFNHFLNVQIF
eukprot:2333319-Amphidinium_carterae.1